MAVVAIALILALTNWRAAPAGVDAPPGVFSAQRAMRTLAGIARVPHPSGSGAHAEVRAQLVRELAAQGWSPQVQSSFSIGTDHYTAGMVHNIVARLPGSRPGKALLLVAHYDTVPVSPGAADDGAAVAAIIEGLRALRAGASVRNDIIVLFSDGEEVNSLGAEAFVQAHPWARDVGLALNFEYRGNGGPMLLFETSPGNAQLIGGLRTLQRVHANSLMYEVYRFLGNPTDMGAFRRAGMAGLNFAAIEGAHRYHSEQDTPSALDQAALQQHGDSLLALARHFGDADLSALAGGDSVYFDLAGRWLMAYPAAWATAITVLVLCALAGVLVLAVRKGEARPWRTLLAALAWLPLLALLAGLVHLAWLAGGQLQAERELARFLKDSYWYLGSACLLACGGAMLMLRWLGRWLRVLELTLGAALVWGALLLAATVAAPGATFVLAWPLAALLLSVAWLLCGAVRPAARPALQFFGLLPALLLMTPLIATLHAALPPAMLAVCVLPIVLTMGLCSAALAAWPRWCGAALLAAGVLLLGVAGRAGGFDAANPRPVHLDYVQQDGEPGPVWTSEDAEMHPWAAAILGAGARQHVLPDLYPGYDVKQWAGKGEDLRLPQPVIEIDSVSAAGEGRRIVLRVHSQRNAPHLAVELEGDGVLQASVNGRVYSSDARDNWRLDAYGMGAQPLRVELLTRRAHPVSVHVTDTTYGLPPGVAATRPVGVMSRPGGWSDRMMAVRVRSID
ncbi:M28 family peptidase [Rugamonas sp. CCM 8940]|uniref:M28 family peptidase n=1 Tax=Rugamonas sp. CCM 8940 TaxID=2765359 RepID=UPI001F1F5F6A|nr:M28 family peptidase [Rugamonas sp. CCM 8940]